MSDYAIEMSGVSKWFGRKVVLSGVTLNVERGKTFAFLGRNGAGKTTSIRLLMGLLHRSDGAVRVLGLDPEVDPLLVRDRVGYLAEDQTMYGWMRVEEIVRYIAPFYTSWDHDLARMYLGEFELPLRTKIKHLSKGQNVRLGLVLALAHRPELVILDDPALGLDPIMRKQFNRDLITHLQGEGRTVFYSSHLLYEVEPIADEVAILDNGRVLRQSGTEELRADVKQLIVTPQGATQIDARRVLDQRPDGEEVALVVDNAAALTQQLSERGELRKVVDLNLDEIFEAYVVGKKPADDALPAQSPLPTPA
ncbi:putative ABC transporter ATP-binding protein YbhF [Posidoniimonas polymericola]|uniref:Putative ABC transporter ATP-binding protein YbhF n=1 Tax=Posidoniimonas polymericola TaxID=2528002 RepID=A0A5C5YIG6_9BACT|nr:ABC transporter ATP-binding protein [Posidoniimonas polymericola]TWT74649.1 putative ABC transporter ATP-binding protein YbhF [Posidoniimonas polymericola]